MSNKIIISNGYKYKKITSDLEFELAISSKSLAFLHKRVPRLYPFNELVDRYYWVDATFRTAKSLGKEWFPYSCIGTLEDDETIVNLGPTEEADTNSSDS